MVCISRLIHVGFILNYFALSHQDIYDVRQKSGYLVRRYDFVASGLGKVHDMTFRCVKPH